MKKEKMKSRKEEAAQNSKAVRGLLRQMPSPFDPLGSYTGRPADGSERPVQDADDL